MIKLLSWNKEFGKPYINYQVIDENNIVIKEGKFKEYEQISNLNSKLKINTVRIMLNS